MVISPCIVLSGHLSDLRSVWVLSWAKIDHDHSVLRFVPEHVFRLNIQTKLAQKSDLLWCLCEWCLLRVKELWIHRPCGKCTWPAFEIWGQTIGTFPTVLTFSWGFLSQNRGLMSPWKCSEDWHRGDFDLRKLAWVCLEHAFPWLCLFLYSDFSLALENKSWAQSRCQSCLDIRL